MTAPDPEERQRIINEPQPQDNDPVALSHIQLMKCAAIMGAIIQGNTGYNDIGMRVVMFLQNSATEASFGGIVVPTAAELWAEIDSAPWPMPGPSRSQQDVGRSRRRQGWASTMVEAVMQLCPGRVWGVESPNAASGPLFLQLAQKHPGVVLLPDLDTGYGPADDRRCNTTIGI